MSAPTHLKAHLALTSVALIYGINYFSLKEVFNENYDSFAILAIRAIIGVLFFAGFHFFFIREKIRDRKDYIRLIACAMFGICINQLFFLWGLSLTSKVNSAVLMITTPVFVFLAAWILKQEFINFRKLLGLFFSLGGATILILSAANPGSAGDSNALGDLFIIVNAASYGLYLVLVRPLILKYNTLTIINWIFIFGAIPNIAIGIGPLAGTDFSGISGAAVFGIIWLVFFTTIGAYFLNAWAMKRVPSSAVGMYIYFQPLFVTLGSMLLGSSEVTFLKVAMMVLILAGVYMVTMASRGKAT